MMRKIIISQVFSLLFVLSSYAGQIDVNNAKNVAKNFYWEKVTLSKGMDYNNINLSLVYARSEGNIPVYYIFNVNQDDGFVIIAADDDVYPFLGYTFTGKYIDNIEQPINFIEWMDHNKDQILFVKENGLQADEQISEAWNKYQTKPQPTDPILGVNPLLTTTWDQGTYYNASCPVDNAGPGGHVWAGCVATAMGQVMKFHNHPEQGTGSHSYYCSPYGTLSANFGATTYNWTSMPNSLYSHNSAVATLLYHCGVSVEMMYGPDGSGAYTSDTRSALINYFSYSSTAQYKQKAYYSTSGWEALLRDELEASRPMIYRGQGTGGHAFVCDGYQGTNHFHFNWGWSGYANGYFYVSNLNPGGYNFTTLQAAVIGIQPSALAPVADFTADVTNVNAGDQVQFTDQSTGNVTSRNWTFYGGTPASSTQQNPTITYNTAGNYTVSLTVTGPGGSDTETKTDYITVINVIPDPHFDFEGGDPSNPVWTIYLSNCEFEGEDMQAGDEVAIFDGDIMVGAFVLDQICSPENQFDNDMIAFSMLFTQPGYQAGNSYAFKCWDASQEIESAYFNVELLDPYGDAYTGDVFPAGEYDYSIVGLDFSMAPDAHFDFEGGDPSNPVWTIYLGGGAIEGVDLVPGDEIAIFNGDVMVGAFMLDQVITMDNIFDNDLIVFSELVSQPGYEVGNVYSFKCWDASEELEIEYFEIELFNPYGDAFTGDVFPAGDGEYSMVALDFLSNVSQSFDLSYGFQFISSAVDPDDPDMMIVMADVLNDNLDFVRNSQGSMLRKIGPNWVNGIGNWVVEEGYLVKMNADDSFSITGTLVDPTTPIPVETGFQFVSYFPTSPMDALLAFETIIGDDLDFIRDSEGAMIRKIGPNWINGIGDGMPGEGYLIKMYADSEIIYPAAAKSSGKTTVVPSYLIFDAGNPAEAVYTLYLKGLEIGDEVAAYDGDKMIGATRINSQNAFENELPVFSSLINGQGYEEGNPIILKVWSENNIVSADFTMEAIYDSYVSDVYPEGDGNYSVVNITKGSIENAEETISVYPNPSKGIFNISLEGIKDDISIKVFDLRGKEYSNFESIGSTSTQLDLTELPAGVYFINFSGKNFSEVRKIVIQ